MGAGREGDAPGRQQEAGMNEVKREALGCIARLAEQMAYTAMNGHAATLKAQYDALTRHMAKLKVIEDYVEGAK